jgi:hypothetical protein
MKVASIDTHMALVAMCAGILRKSSGVVQGPGFYTNRERWLQTVEIRQNNEHLMSAVVGMTPTFANGRIKKVCHQTIRVTSHGKLFFEHTRSLKFGKTLQFVAGKSLQKIQNEMSIDGSCGSEKSTDQGRARGDSGQS